MRWEVVTRNVAKLARSPKLALPSPVVLSSTDATAVIDAISDPSLRRLAIVAVHTGLRQGELLGLTWDAIDLDQHKAHVWHALQRIDGRYELVEPKSETSKRTVPLTTAAVDALLEERRSQREAQLRAKHWHEPIPGLCFTTGTGMPRNGTAITHAFDDAIRTAGLPHLRWHDLRAAHGALLVVAGTDIAVVSKMLGHSSVGVTARHYAGVGDALRREASDRFAALLAPSI
jgi:integrase